ncbi:hypothetical protein D9M68_278020 [compost metagenome]
MHRARSSRTAAISSRRSRSTYSTEKSGAGATHAADTQQPVCEFAYRTGDDTEGPARAGPADASGVSSRLARRRSGSKDSSRSIHRRRFFCWPPAGTDQRYGERPATKAGFRCRNWRLPCRVPVARRLRSGAATSGAWAGIRTGLLAAGRLCQRLYYLLYRSQHHLQGDAMRGVWP